MASQFVTIVKDGQLQRVSIRKPQAPRRTIGAWRDCIAEAIGFGRSFVFRRADKWHVCRISPMDSKIHTVRTFQRHQREAAEMYLLHVEKPRGKV